MVRHGSSRVGVRDGSVEGDRAGGRAVEPADEAQQGRLAAARGADDGDDLTGGEFDVHIAKNRTSAVLRGEGALDIGEANGARGRAGSRGIESGHAFQDA
jgi:hypothetical protein